jgi:hypothetical protein
LRGHLDVWDQYVDEIELNSLSYASRLEAFPDEELWAVVNTYTDLIEVPSTYHRLGGLFAWKYGVTGIRNLHTLAWFGAEEDQVVSPWNQDNLSTGLVLSFGRAMISSQVELTLTGRCHPCAWNSTVKLMKITNIYSCWRTTA